MHRVREPRCIMGPTIGRGYREWMCRDPTCDEAMKLRESDRGPLSYVSSIDMLTFGRGSTTRSSVLAPRKCAAFANPSPKRMTWIASNVVIDPDDPVYYTRAQQPTECLKKSANL